MNVFDTHRQVMGDYRRYIHSFINIADQEIKRVVEEAIDEGRLWPSPLLQFNPAYATAGTISDAVQAGLLHEGSQQIFDGYSLYQHQREAIELGVKGKDFVVTSGTGSGKSLTYISAIFNHLLAAPEAEGVTAVIVYPMNALINSQRNQLEAYRDNYQRTTGKALPITFGQYTGQEKEEARQAMRENPPQLLLTNYMMLELLLTRLQERPIRDAIYQSLRFLVFDELHTYRGRQGADVALLIRRIQALCRQQEICCIGTSATMVSLGSDEEQKAEVAKVAAAIFGRRFEPSQIIGEALARSLEAREPTKDELHAAVANGIDLQAGEAELRRHPLAVWLEASVAIEERDGKLCRRDPMPMEAVIQKLAAESGAAEDQCRQALEDALQWVSLVNERRQAEGARHTLLPFKLHQFIAQTGSVYTTLDQGKARHITLQPGIWKQDDQDRKPIFTNVFSRSSGHPFLCVSLADGKLSPRDFHAFEDDEGAAEDGYLIVGEDLWDPDADLESLPPAWTRVRANGERVPATNRRAFFPRKIHFDDYGAYSETEPKTHWGWFMKRPLLFDPTGGVFYDTLTKEGTKLARLGSEGRATSTTITAFSALHRLQDAGLSLRDQKLLSFTDNRQDAALQAGHFNDFVQVVRLRAGIWKALAAAEGQALNYATLGEAIFRALALPFTDYANQDREPDFAPAKARFERALQDYLFFRALADLRRSWRIVLPNLEQCALLQVDYADLEELAASEQFWAGMALLSGMSRPARKEFLHGVLDHFRLEYALYSENYLTPPKLEEFGKGFHEQLKPPWTLDTDEKLPRPYVLRLDPLHRSARLPHKSLGPLSAFGKHLKQLAMGAGHPDLLSGEGYRDFTLQLLDKLQDAGFLYRETARSQQGEDTPVFRLRIERILWRLGDSKTVRADLVKRRAYKAQAPKPNAFFQEVYQRDFTVGKRLHSQDHTGQLSVADRQEREERFRADWYQDDAKRQPDEDRIRSQAISALFCSPTMELGVDIGGLSVVHMRNAPPNPANYVQRSGRAGRSGQGALVFTYCSVFSAHDRHCFLNQPELVAGAVQAPRINLCNKELLSSHLHALAVSVIGLPGLGDQKPSLSQLVTLQEPDQPLAPGVVKGLQLGDAARARIAGTFQQVIKDFAGDLQNGRNPWYADGWVDQTLRDLEQSLDQAMKRWRQMYQAADALLDRATAAIRTGHLAGNSPEYRRHQRHQEQASRQLALLLNQQGGAAELNEFYPYRYLASEGFLPGYNFTRLPLRIFLPSGSTAGEYISRPRSIALREFGPHNIIYHNGRKFRVTQLVTQDADSMLMEAKVSSRSGYFLMGDQLGMSACPFSGLDLSDNANKEHLHDLLEMTESRGQETARITCEEEERISRGYQLQHFFHMDGGDFSALQQARVHTEGAHLLTLRFIPAARLVSLNRGWRARQLEGFPLGLTSGNWDSHSPRPAAEPATEEQRLVKLWTSTLADALYIEPIAALGLSADAVVTLQHALKRAVETVFQAEPSEIGVEALGDPAHPNILLFEAAEGSLGILSQFVEEVAVFQQVIAAAEQLCRYDDPEYQAPASYDDLLSYYNQRDHDRLDRFLIRDALAKLRLAQLEIQTNPSFATYDEHFKSIMESSDPASTTEPRFLQHLYDQGLRLPDAAQKRVQGLYCQPDFFYAPRTWVFCDGKPHDAADIRQRDQEQRQLLLDRGDDIWFWHYREDLAAKIAQRPDLFRKVR